MNAFNQTETHLTQHYVVVLVENMNISVLTESFPSSVVKPGWAWGLVAVASVRRSLKVLSGSRACNQRGRNIHFMYSMMIYIECNTGLHKDMQL